MLARSLVLVLAALLALAGPAAAYPDRPVDLVVSFPPGGVTDQVGRTVAGYLSKKWGQPINVVNKAGGGGVTGAFAALSARPDGYTMLVTVTSVGSTNPAMDSKLPYKWDQFTFIARTNISPLVVFVKADAPWKTLRELADAIKADPTKLKYGTSAAGGPSTFVTAQLTTAIGADPTKLTRVVLNGGAPTIAAVAGGHVDFAAQNLAEVTALIEGGKIRGLGITSETRAPQIKDVPTTREAGFPTVSLIGYNGIVGPRNLPAPVVDKWLTSVQQMVKDPEFIATMERLGVPVAYLGPAEFKEFLRRDYETALDFATRLGMRK